MEKAQLTGMRAQERAPLHVDIGRFVTLAIFADRDEETLRCRVLGDYEGYNAYNTGAFRYENEVLVAVGVAGYEQTG